MRIHVCRMKMMAIMKPKREHLLHLKPQTWKYFAKKKKLELGFKKFYLLLQSSSTRITFFVHFLNFYNKKKKSSSLAKTFAAV